MGNVKVFDLGLGLGVLLTHYLKKKIQLKKLSLKMCDCMIFVYNHVIFQENISIGS